MTFDELKQATALQHKHEQLKEMLKLPAAGMKTELILGRYGLGNDGVIDLTADVACEMIAREIKRV